MGNLKKTLPVIALLVCLAVVAYIGGGRAADAAQGESTVAESDASETISENEAEAEPEPEVIVVKRDLEKEDFMGKAYFGGGCFWGMEKFMDMVPGVTDVISGYANGDDANYPNPTYEEVCTGKTGYKEVVEVSFNPDKVEYEMLVRAFFEAIDPTLTNQQGNDIGYQYQTGVYYGNEAQRVAAERVSQEVADSVSVFAVEVLPIENFYEAEEYHQDYLKKHPCGYCHITNEEIRSMQKLFNIEGKTYEKPSDVLLKAQLSEEQYYVTQYAGTEAPFQNEYWNSFEKGIYVDIVSGEPLFSSSDKYESSCGWPAFSQTKNLDIDYRIDTGYGMVRTEVRSGGANSHLGHVFENDKESPTGIRYCINSASLDFIPYDEMEERGYGDYLSWIRD